MSHGYVDLLEVYSVALLATLQSWASDHGSTLLQYVKTYWCALPPWKPVRNIVFLFLTIFAVTGHKVSKTKLQWCQPQVKYLGFTLSNGQRSISSK